MATSTCVKCGNTRFELKENTPSNSNFKYFFIQCSSCGGVVGVTEFFNSSQQNIKTHEALKRIANQVGTSVNL